MTAEINNTGTERMLGDWSEKAVTQADLSTATNPDLRGSLAAMRRAARAARQLTIETNTCLVRVHDGVVVRIGREQLRAELAAEGPTIDAEAGAAR